MLQKIKNICIRVADWIATDGLLHILACYASMLTFEPTLGVAFANLFTVIIALIKEVYDVIKKRNNVSQVLHDIACDIIGILIANIVIAMF